MTKSMKVVGIALFVLSGACSGSVDGTGNGDGQKGGGLLGGKTGEGGGSGERSEEDGRSGGALGAGGGASGTPGTNSAACSISTSNPACDACVNEGCCQQIKTCEGSSACTSLYDCMTQCGSDQACASQCVERYPSGRELLLDAIQCVDRVCKAKCG